MVRATELWGAMWLGIFLIGLGIVFYLNIVWLGILVQIGILIFVGGITRWTSSVR